MSKQVWEREFRPGTPGRHNVSLDPALHQALKGIAGALNWSIARFVNDAVEGALRQQAQTDADVAHVMELFVIDD